jgi:hypothetical protein
MAQHTTLSHEKKQAFHLLPFDTAGLTAEIVYRSAI